MPTGRVSVQVPLEDPDAELHTEPEDIMDFPAEPHPSSVRGLKESLLAVCRNEGHFSDPPDMLGLCMVTATSALCGFPGQFSPLPCKIPELLPFFREYDQSF